MMYFVHYGKEIGPHPVHFVDKSQPGDPVLVGLTPNSLGLGLYTAHGAERGYGTVEYTQGTLYFYGKIHMSGGVYDIDLVPVFAAIPKRCGSSRGDGYTPFLFLNHPIHSRSPFVNLPYFMGLARIIENAFRRSGLTGIDMGHDANIPCIF
jgi:hypothetical protein